MKLPKIILFSTAGVVMISLVYFILFAYSESLKIRVTLIDSGPNIQFDQIQPSIQITEMISCQPADYATRYPAYAEDNSKRALCLTGYVEASALIEIIADLEQSIADVNLRLASLAKTKNYLSKFSAANLNGLSLVAIPAGVDATKQYPTANNISIMCLKDGGDIIESAAAVGNATVITNKIFESLPAIAFQKMQEARDNANKMLNLLKTFKAPTVGKVLTGFFSKSASAEIDANIAIVGQSLALALANQKIASDYFIAVTMDDLQTNYKGLFNSNKYIATTFNWHYDLDRKGNPIIKRTTEKTAKLTTHMLETIDKYISRDKIPIETTLMDITFADIQYTGKMPEADLYREFQNAIVASITRYSNLLVGYQTARNKVKADLDKIIANNYNCQ